VACGLRRGDILGLRWKDVDIQAGSLTVNQAAEELRGQGGVTFKSPKSAKSRRTITLPSFVVQALTRHRGEQAEIRLLLGPAYRAEYDLVVCHEDGTPRSPNGLSHLFAKLLERKGLPHVRFHDLRHSHASQLLKQGVNVKVVSERLGHADIQTTLRVYAHVLPGLQEEAARTYDAALRAALGEG